MALQVRRVITGHDDKGRAIVQIDEVVEIGGLDPEAIVTPGIFVDRVVPVGYRPWLDAHGAFVGGVDVNGEPVSAQGAATGGEA